MSTRQFAHKITLAEAAGGSLSATVDCEASYWNEGDYSRRVCRIKLRSDRCEVDGEGDDFFDAFCRVREALVPHGLAPLCYGASRNVYPSGMGRDMGDGLVAYKFRSGQPVGHGDLVNIFAEGADVEPASVQAQREFWEACLRSADLSHNRPAQRTGVAGIVSVIRKLFARGPGR